MSEAHLNTTERPDSAALPAACRVCHPALKTDAAPVIFSSPHSGRFYPPAFLAQLKVPEMDLRRTEDAFIDELFAATVRHGATLIHATYPRSYVDLNRDANELDRQMFEDGLPRTAGRPTPHVRAGLGSLPKIGAAGQQIYATRLSRAEGRDRLTRIHDVYHATLQAELETQRAKTGQVLLIDCHSMPSQQVGRKNLPDVILGDRFGSSCAPGLTLTVEKALRSQGLSVSRNAPYAGGYTTRRYGRPQSGQHALQIELNRGLYLDEQRVEKSAGFERLKDALEPTIAAIIAFSQTPLEP